MAVAPGEYQKLQPKTYAPRALRETAEGKYWQKFAVPVTAQQVGGVTSISFSQTYPYNYAVTASTRVVIYDGNSRQTRRTISRFRDIAYSGSFRSDGKLLVAGGEEGIVQVFDPASRTVLRQLKAHQKPVHVTRFSHDRIHVLSGSDDVTVRYWDLSSGSQINRFEGHTDYVRAAAGSPASMDVWATGGYDHMCKLWDVRSGECSMTLDHGAPVEDVAFFPAGSLLVTAGGTSLCVWDVMAGGTLLKRLSNFQKTVTGVVLSPQAGPDRSAGPRMLACSLDGHVKVFELDSFKVTHASKYPAPILSMGLSPDCSLLAVGMADGSLSTRRHARAAMTPRPGMPLTPAQRRAQRHYKPRLTASSFRFFIRGQSEKAAAADYVVAARRRAGVKEYDKLLRKFRFREALDAALSVHRADVVMALLEELAARGALTAALGGRDASSLMPLLQFVERNVADPRHSRVLSGVAHRILDAYAPVVGTSPEVDQKLRQLRDRVMDEVRLADSLMSLQGSLEAILAASMGALSLGPQGAEEVAVLVR